MNAFGLDEADEFDKIKAKYEKMGKKVHFGTLRTICQGPKGYTREDWSSEEIS